MALTAMLASPFAVFVGVFFFVQVSQSMTAGNMQVIGSLIAPAHARGKFFGTWRLIAEMGATVSPIAFALLAETVSYGASFVFIAATALLAATVLGTAVRSALESAGEPRAPKGEQI
jgi:sugar phosphate permease